MQTPYKKYKVRSGTIDSGKEYEFKMVALLSLRCFLEDAEHIWIVSNADSVGAFDDIIFHVQTEAQTDITYMLQLKHKDNPKNITETEFLSTKGDFSLTKYCSDIFKLNQSLNSPTKTPGIITDLGDFHKIHFVLFTNRGVNEYELLHKIGDVNNTLSILNTNRYNFNLYKFNFNKLPCDINTDSDYYSNLYLISNQAHAKHLDEEISGEIKKVVANFELTHVNIKIVAEKFIKYITEWAKGNLGGHHYLTKHDLYCKLGELLLYQYELDFSRDEYAYYDDSDHKHIWNEITCDKVITIVDTDDYVLFFLKLYIGSEVKKYIQEDEYLSKLWADNLSEQAQNVFYQENNDLKNQMLKIVGNHGRINFLDIYKSLWFSNKVPLLLEASNIVEYQNIMGILKLSNYNSKVIIVNKNSFSLTVMDNVQKNFVTLKDLNFEERNVILDQSVKLQGRSSVMLRKLVNDDMLEEIKCRDIIHILSDDFSVGNKYERVSDCFIERTLSKIFIDTEALRGIKNELFLIQKTEKKECSFEDFDSTNIIVYDENESLELEKLKSGGKVIHRLILHSNCLEWKETFGNVKNIRQYQLEEVENLNSENWTDVENLIKCDNILNTTQIISASPGMGKSTLLDYVADQTSTNMWVLRINLNVYHDYYETIKRKNLNYGASGHLVYFNNAILKKFKCNNIKLSQLVFERLLNAKNILVLLDGFDEISISYEKEVTQIAKCLHDEGYLVFITTRPVKKLHLEEHLHSLSITLHPFTIYDRINFLTRYFTRIAGNSESESIIEKFVIQLLRAAQINLNDRSLDFTGIPLQNLLLADVFSDELKTSLKTGVINLNDKFDLLYLYEEFINRKNEILCTKFGKGCKTMRMAFEKHQQFFALKYLFSEEIQDLGICREIEKYCEENQQNIQLLQLEGVLVMEEDYIGTEQIYKISFIHRTFAEYLAALWLSENVKSKDVIVTECVETLLKTRFRYSSLSFLFKIFDCILAKNCYGHLAIIHDQIDELNDVIKVDPDIVDTVDAGGRTILHMMAIYGINYSNIFCETIVEDKMLNIVKEIPNYKITNDKDTVLGYSALDYAVVNWNLAVANKMCEKSQFLRIAVDINMLDEYFNYCAILEFKSLFKVLLLHFASEKVLFWKYTKDTTIASFCSISTLSDIHNRNLFNFASDFGATTLWDLYKFESMNDLRFTAAYGSKDLLHLLLSKGADVNKQDIYHNTPLHYAVRHDRLDMVQLLISKGAEVNKQGRNGFTAMHYAAQHGCDKTANELLVNNADINKPDSDGNTPLFIALDFIETDFAKLLISKGAKINLRNNKGATPLHYAAEHGFDEIVSLLICKAVNRNKNCNTLRDEDSVLLCNCDAINCQKKNGKTPLHSSLCGPTLFDDDDVQQYKKTVCLLLDNGADVNIQDNHGNTALHYVSRRNYWDSGSDRWEASQKFCKYAVKLFLSKGSDVNLKNEEGKTALDLAVADKKTEIIFLLQQKSNDGANNQPIEMEASYVNCILF